MKPLLRRIKGYGGFEVVFPKTGLAPVRMDTPDGYLIRDRLLLAPGIEVRLAANEKNVESAPPKLLRSGQPLPLDFARFLTDPKWWSPAVLNETTYQVGRGFYNQRAYWFFGLAQAHGKTYLGVSWYSPAASDKHDVLALIFRLDGNGKSVEAVPIHAVPEVSRDPTTDAPRPLLLDTQPSGDLVLGAGGALSRLSTSGQWSPLSSPLLKRFPALAGYAATWDRERWRVIGHQWESGNTIQFRVVILEAATQKTVSEFTWHLSSAGAAR